MLGHRFLGQIPWASCSLACLCDTWYRSKGGAEGVPSPICCIHEYSALAWHPSWAFWVDAADLRCLCDPMMMMMIRAVMPCGWEFNRRSGVALAGLTIFEMSTTYVPLCYGHLPFYMLVDSDLVPCISRTINRDLNTATVCSEAWHCQLHAYPIRMTGLRNFRGGR